MSSNYSDVLSQVQAFGLDIGALVVGDTKSKRYALTEAGCSMFGVRGREKRGWTLLHEIARDDGAGTIIVGTFGVFVGNEPNTQKVRINKQAGAMTAAQSEALRARLAADRKRIKAMRDAEIERAANMSQRAWLACAPVEGHAYLAKKGVGAHGLRQTPTGSLLVPMTDAQGKVWGLQAIRAPGAKGKMPKEYWPKGLDKQGHYHLIGSPRDIVLVAEGYASAASVHEATGLPTAVAFDAGNVVHVAQALSKAYKNVRVLICADHDCYQTCAACCAVTDVAGADCDTCGEPHKKANAGVDSAQAAALACSGSWLAPLFGDEAARRAARERGVKITDFNDLQAIEGQHVVRAQIEAHLTALGWLAAAPASTSRATTDQGGAGTEDLRPIESPLELLERFSLVYGMNGAVFDALEHVLVSKGDMQDLCRGGHVYKGWQESAHRRIVRVRDVGFDPGGDDPAITCNLWAGWPTQPVAGKCEYLLGLLQHMCADDDDPAALYAWVLRWLAYPLQHPGAKMKTTLVIHGPQGTGKNLFFEVLMSIYGQYGRVIDQGAIEDKFNDWASRKLFLIADEVVARSDLYHIKNKLKSLITGDWIRINPKNVASYDERNHANLVFLSNETMPVILEADDRRHTVIWTPEKLSAMYYADTLKEIQNGGAAALHDALLRVPLGDFHPGTPPPKTSAKEALVGLSLDSTSRFYVELAAGDIPGILLMPAKTQDMYELYKAWCQRVGQRPAPQSKLLAQLQRKHGATVARKAYHTSMGKAGPHGFVLFKEGQQKPEGESEMAWLGGRAEAFSHGLKDYRGTAYGG